MSKLFLKKIYDTKFWLLSITLFWSLRAWFSISGRVEMFWAFCRMNSWQKVSQKRQNFAGILFFPKTGFIDPEPLPIDHCAAVVRRFSNQPIQTGFIHLLWRHLFIKYFTCGSAIRQLTSTFKLTKQKQTKASKKANEIYFFIIQLIKNTLHYYNFIRVDIPFTRFFCARETFTFREVSINLSLFILNEETSHSCEKAFFLK